MSGLDIVGVALLLAILLTPVSGLVSGLLLRRYAARIASLTGQQRRRRKSDPSHSGRSIRQTFDGDGDPPVQALALARGRHNVRLHLLASTAAAVAAAAIFLLAIVRVGPTPDQQTGGLGLNYQTITLFVLIALTFATPMLVIAPVVHPPGRGRAWLGAGSWLAVVVLLITFGQGSHHQNPVLLFLIVVVPSALPAVAIVALTGRRGLRGVGWLLAPSVTAVIFDLACVYPVVAGARPGPLVAVALGFTLITTLFSATIWGAYRRGRLSDHGILALLVWFYETVVLVYFSALSGADDARILWSLVPFVVFASILLVGFGAARHRSVQTPRHVLLLRSFALQRASVRLLRELEVYWRYIGSVLLIGGTDLAAETLEPDELVDWLAGRIRSRVIAEPAEVPGRLAGLSLVPDDEGRYRVHDLVCADAAWKAACNAAMELVSAVVIDIRGLAGPTSGLAWEIEVLSTIPPSVVVAVVWPDTDPAFLTPLRLAGHHVVSVASGERDLRAREVLAVLAAATERLGLVS
ncbi:hypothetical protein [Actinomycetospora sp.]|uniref:hypothetical protein n=1 Tax=Actinomycetospora sp. TaxID=1872135 RepID=UPI002F42D61E